MGGWAARKLSRNGVVGSCGRIVGNWEADFWFARNSGVSRYPTRLPRRDELLTPNEMVRNCWLLAVRLRLFLGKIDHDDL